MMMVKGIMNCEDRAAFKDRKSDPCNIVKDNSCSGQGLFAIALQAFLESASLRYQLNFEEI